VSAGRAVANKPGKPSGRQKTRREAIGGAQGGGDTPRERRLTGPIGPVLVDKKAGGFAAVLTGHEKSLPGLEGFLRFCPTRGAVLRIFVRQLVRLGNNICCFCRNVQEVAGNGKNCMIVCVLGACLVYQRLGVVDYAEVMENMGQGLLVFAPAGAGAAFDLVYESLEASRMLGMTPGMLEQADSPLNGCLPSALAEVAATRKRLTTEKRLETATGVRWLRMRVFLLKGARLGVSLEDATEARLAQQKLAESELMFRLISENSQDCLSLHGDGARYIYVSPSVKSLLGYEPEEIVGRTPFDFAHPNDLQSILEPFRRMMMSGAPYGKVTARYRRKDGELRWLETVVARLDSCPLPGVLFQGSTRDVTERKQLEERLTEMGYRDALTGLYNRGYFEEELKRLDRRRGGSVGIIIVDVDGLKVVNDALGHDAGDELLKRTAQTLVECFRHEDLIARIGGDEFAVLLNDVAMEDLRQAGRRIMKTTEEDNCGNAPVLSLSLGYAVGENNSTPMRELFRAADDNMYRDRLYRGKSDRGAIVNILRRLLTERDFATEEHGTRLESLAVRLGAAAGLSEERLGDLALFAQFHDVGKVGIPDAILSKPGPLTPQERKEVARHCDVGYRIASASSELLPIAEWILRHHEWWNGEGYPLNLAGENIPLECRLLAIADAYDAMTSDRPYRKAMSHEAALAEIRRCAGTQFDPALVDVFMGLDFRV
jgi:diguanylate cyclase (GGDEF)-like protein/PAS domain S-box-containing protein